MFAHVCAACCAGREGLVMDLTTEIMATTKKIKALETPIDQMETFVSISKNFADSDLSVGEKLKTLYTLQRIDSRIDKIVQLRGELPLEVEALENEIAGREAKADAIHAQIEECTRKIAEYKNQIADDEALLVKYKAQVDEVANSREFASLSKEIENLDLLKQIAEKNIVEAKEAIAAKKIEAEEVKEKIAVRNDDLAEKRKELAEIIASTSKDEEKLQAERAVAAAKIDARTMSAYEHIRNSNSNHLAVVTVYNENACGGCFNMITPQRLVNIAANNKLIVCEYCGRILVNPEFE